MARRPLTAFRDWVDQLAFVSLVKRWGFQKKAWKEVSPESKALLEQWIRGNDPRALRALYALLQEEDENGSVDT